MERITRLRQYFRNEESYNNLINIYKQLSGKENLHLRLFLKAITICCLNAQYERVYKNRGWMTIDTFFIKKNNKTYQYPIPFTIEELKDKYRKQVDSNWRILVFGQYPIQYMNKLINIQNYSNPHFKKI